jgi:hypothetical protein
LNKPESPLDVLKKFSELINKKTPEMPIKLAMIGDRLDNDIEPPAKLLNNNYINTFWLRSLKYGNCKSTDEKYPPDYVAETLSQIKALLLSNDIWENKYCVYDLPFFCWKIDFINKDYVPKWNELLGSKEAFQKIGLNIILTGMGMFAERFELTNKICTKVLIEHFMINPDDNIMEIINSTLDINDSMKKNYVKVVKRSARILAALVNESDFLLYNIKSKPDIGSVLRNKLDNYLDYFKKYFLEKDYPLEAVTVENALKRLS